MTLQTLNSIQAYPNLLRQDGGAPVLGNLDSLTVADASYPSGTAHYTVIYFTPYQSMAVTHIGFKASTATGSPTAIVRIETVSAGLHSGTLVTASGEVADTGAITTTFGYYALGATVNLVAGTPYAIVIQLRSGTALTVGNTANIFATTGMPYRSTNVTGSNTKGGFAGANIVLGSSGTTFYCVEGFLPASAVAGNAFSNTNSAKKGLRFILPFPATIVGMRYYSGTATGNYNFRLENDAGTELGNTNTAASGAASSGLATAFNHMFFDNAYDAVAGTAYRIVVEPSSATTVNFYTATMPATLEYRPAWPGGTNFNYQTWSTAAGSEWVDVPTQVPLMDVLYRKLDDGTGSGAAGVIGG